jgi:hypothetical protein
MKRDMNIIRQILLNVEDDKYPYGGRVNLDGVSDQICGHHVALIFDAGLAEGRLIKSADIGIAAASIDRLTSAGHDFCDGIRRDTIWHKVQERFIKPGASFGFPVVIEFVKLELHRIAFRVPPHS